MGGWAVSLPAELIKATVIPAGAMQPAASVYGSFGFSPAKSVLVAVGAEVPP